MASFRGDGFCKRKSPVRYRTCGCAGATAAWSGGNLAAGGARRLAVGGAASGRGRAPAPPSPWCVRGRPHQDQRPGSVDGGGARLRARRSPEPPRRGSAVGAARGVQRHDRRHRAGNPPNRRDPLPRHPQARPPRPHDDRRDPGHVAEPHPARPGRAPQPPAPALHVGGCPAARSPRRPGAQSPPGPQSWTPRPPGPERRAGAAAR